MTHPTIPAELVPRILALKDWIGEWWPAGCHLDDWGQEKIITLDVGFEGSYESHWPYDLLCMACVRALQRERWGVRLPAEEETGHVVLSSPGNAARDIHWFDNSADQLSNLIAACEWAKERMK